ncbi:MAG: 30S ribosomal protein S13 [Sulfolobales archaeon]|nr:30S ribosomal protein S13 [Sulfolobales archaeon]MCX8186811.1 30S ribosomal protein S13 [Sulfolobales archaeon]MDW7969856.1 30S ribosomal protein S13 [Sulfolobales archaeon]
MPEATFKHIVRVAGTDLNGNLKLQYGLLRIKGVGYQLATYVVRVLGLSPSLRVGYLSDSDVKNIESVLANPLNYGIPPWALNRRKDYASGNDLHFIGADLMYVAREDIEREKRIKSWRGIRHALGLKVRGQRTHTTGRLGPTLGVSKKK